MLLLPHGEWQVWERSRARAVPLCSEMQLSGVAGVAEGPTAALETLRSPEGDRSGWLDGALVSEGLERSRGQGSLTSSQRTRPSLSAFLLVSF